MDRIWQWAWDRYKKVFVGGLCRRDSRNLPVYLIPSFVVVAIEESHRYAEAAAVTVVAVLVLVYVIVLQARHEPLG